MKKTLNTGIHSKRTSTGAGIIALGLIVAFFAVLPLSLLYFEMARFSVMQQELHNITDFAALSGTAALASVPVSGNIAAAQTVAMDQAKICFEANSILGTQFNASNVSAAENTGSTPAPPSQPHNVVLNITLLDQNGVLQSTGSSTAATMRVEAWYMDNTVFASQILPVQQHITAYAFSNGGLPKVDCILCFDVSGSMDDTTFINLVKARWDAGNSKVVCDVVTTNQGGASTPDTIYNVFLPPFTGTSFDASQPQNCSFGNFPNSAIGSNQGDTYAYYFTEGPYPPYGGTVNPLVLLRAKLLPLPAGQTLSGVLEQGCPPGNYPSGLLPNGHDPTAYTGFFTDCICADVVGKSLNGHTFSNLDTCVAASRGNLESGALFNNSQFNTDTNISATPGAGWYADYWTLVRNNSHPISDAITGSQNFFQTINTSTNAHFGLVTFANTIGTATNSQFYNAADPTTTNRNVDLNWLPGGTNQFPLPYVQLSSGSSNYDPSNSTGVTACLLGSTTGGYLPLPLGPTGKTDIADALNRGLTDLTGSNTRAGAKKAVVLFTDGIPNVGTNTSPPDYGAYTSASNASGQNIPIYTIGLSQNPNIIPQEDALLGDNQNGSGPGIAYIAGNGAIYVSVTAIQNLPKAFQTIARSLCVIQ